MALLDDIVRHNRQDVATLSTLLVRLCRIYDRPETLTERRDLFSIGKALEKQGELGPARELYRVSAIPSSAGTLAALSGERVAGSPDMQPAFRLHFAEPLAGVKYVVLAEDIAQGQRVEGFRITKNGEPYASYEGTTIGHKRICALRDPFADRNPLEDDTEELISSLTVQITAARDSVVLKSIQVF